MEITKEILATTPKKRTRPTAHLMGRGTSFLTSSPLPPPSPPPLPLPFPRIMLSLPPNLCLSSSSPSFLRTSSSSSSLSLPFPFPASLSTSFSFFPSPPFFFFPFEWWWLRCSLRRCSSWELSSSSPFELEEESYSENVDLRSTLWQEKIRI